MGIYKNTILTVFLLACIRILPVAAENNTVPLQRFALVIGTNNGGSDRVALRYADRDALAFSGVLTGLGAVNRENLELLLDPGLEDIDAGFFRIKNRVEKYKDTTARTELVVYYSGHSNEHGLLINEDLYSYKTFRDAIKDIPVDVRLAILDSCSSGSFTRMKGGIRKPAFLIDAANEMTGYAFLTSSAEDEAAQESDSIGGSFFTHYLVSGLRGAADMTRDKIVTLNEAYSYAYKETLARTEKTQFGAQHPKYDIQLTGTGDLVLTDLRRTDAGLLFDENIEGHFFIRDSNDNLVAELSKKAGSPVELGVEPGKYTVILVDEEFVYESRFSISGKQKKQLNLEEFHLLKKETTVARGDKSGDEDTAGTKISGLEEDLKDLREELESNIFNLITGRLEDAGIWGHSEDWNNREEKPEEPMKQEKESDERNIVLQPMKFSLLPDISFDGTINNNKIYNFSLNILIGSSYSIRGCEISGLGSIISGDLFGLHLSGVTNWVSQEVNGVQLATLFNWSGRIVNGAQISFVNFSGGGITGTQIGGIGNFSVGYVTGIQIGGIVNIGLSSMTGIQLGGLVNYIDDFSDGVQIGGVVNLAEKHISGLQLSGLLNYSGSHSGLQLAGLINTTKATTGAQISGLVNISGDVAGLQLAGLVNIADRVSGVQIGLFNFSRSYSGGLPLGLINIEGEGENRLALWTEQAQTFNLDFRFGTKYSYTVLSAGMKYGTEPVRWTTGAGFGLHLPLSWLHLNVDATANAVFYGFDTIYNADSVIFFPAAKAFVGFTVFNRFGIFAGVNAQIHIPGMNDSLFPALEEDPMVMEYPYFNIKPRIIAGIQF